MSESMNGGMVADFRHLVRFFCLFIVRIGIILNECLDFILMFVFLSSLQANIKNSLTFNKIYVFVFNQTLKERKAGAGGKGINDVSFC